MYDSFSIGLGESLKTNVYEANTKHKLTPYERNKLWKKANLEKYKEQTQRKYLSKKNKLMQSQQL